ncbi:uncharacterized protein LOC133190634 [Saccostrea echinata]|uniref:uncharacterized protein LOC133190634 n=1 Tax=Saccostrea echinata TaxID=191078 RepID=UPI002A7FE1F8|nr:uncharacterized protein LOC133190634 [Saccostrea echinata]
MTESTKPDVILGIETWLSDMICTSEIFHPELGYDVIRRDRDGDAHGGVLIAATTEFGLNHLHIYTKDSELIARDDFILSDINRDNYAINGSQTSREINNAFMQMTDNLNLQQVVDIPTRGEKILDLLLTSHPGQLSRCKTNPPLGNSAHDVVLIDFTIHITRPRLKRRTIYLWKKANINGAVKHHVPSRRTLAKHIHPWITSVLRLLSNRKQKAYKRAKRSKDPKVVKRYKALKGQLHRESRGAHRAYLEDVFSDDLRTNPKRFWTFIKDRKQDSSQIETSKSNDGFLHSDTASKVFNEQFQSVYTREDLSTLPDLGPSSFPTMDKITIHEMGKLKLLKGLRPFNIYSYIQERGETSTIKIQVCLPYINSLQAPGTCCTQHSLGPLHRNNILCDEQHDFRARRSCETQLVITLDHIARNSTRGTRQTLYYWTFQRLLIKSLTNVFY